MCSTLRRVNQPVQLEQRGKAIPPPHGKQIFLKNPQLQRISDSGIVLLQFPPASKQQFWHEAPVGGRKKLMGPGSGTGFSDITPEAPSRKEKSDDELDYEKSKLGRSRLAGCCPACRAQLPPHLACSSSRCGISMTCPWMTAAATASRASPATRSPPGPTWEMHLWLKASPSCRKWASPTS